MCRPKKTSAISGPRYLLAILGGGELIPNWHKFSLYEADHHDSSWWLFSQWIYCSRECVSYKPVWMIYQPRKWHVRCFQCSYCAWNRMNWIRTYIRKCTSTHLGPTQAASSGSCCSPRVDPNRRWRTDAVQCFRNNLHGRFRSAIWRKER